MNVLLKIRCGSFPLLRKGGTGCKQFCFKRGDFLLQSGFILLAFAEGIQLGLCGFPLGEDILDGCTVFFLEFIDKREAFLHLFQPVGIKYQF